MGNCLLYCFQLISLSLLVTRTWMVRSTDMVTENNKLISQYFNILRASEDINGYFCRKYGD